jgi:hypothetical protein
MIDSTISYYWNISKLGVGKSVVAKAEDTPLHRFDTFKLLPAEVAGDTQALSRFRQEAELSALNMPISLRSTTSMRLLNRSKIRVVAASSRT